MIEKLVKELIEIFNEYGISVNESNFEIFRKYADISCNIAFKLAKELGKNPKDVAEEIVGKVKERLPKIVSKVEAKNGFINMYLDHNEFVNLVLKDILEKKEKYGSENNKNKVIVIDYSSPNPGKPLHFGHIRSTIIGDCLARVFKFLGYKVVRSNYLNDRGSHMGKLLLAIEKYDVKNLDVEDPEKLLFELYVKINKEIKENPSLEDKVKDYILKIDKKDPEAIKTLNKIVDVSLKCFKEVYDFLGVKFDEYVRETEVLEIGIKVVKECLEKKIAIKDKTGEVVAKLENYNLPNTVLLRSNGTALYITTDLGLALYRYEKYRFNKCLYVVANEQSLHFKHMFKILELLGYDWVKNCVHVGFGLILLDSGKMSTREGNVVFLRDVLNKVLEKAKEELKKRGIENEEIAKKVAVASVKYSILSVENKKDVQFNIERMLNFDGKTGPYLLYSYVRARSILRKSGKIEPKLTSDSLEKEEIELVKVLSKFPLIIKSVARNYEPYILATYLYELAKKFTEFYHNCPVIGSEEERFRLALVRAFSIVMKTGLNLLGIEVVEEM